MSQYLTKTILAYGDSNTWGEPPGGIGRYDRESRWTGILEALLGSGFHVVEEGLCGRTTAFDDVLTPNRNGLTYIPIALETHSPIQLLIIMLGTNDLNARFNLSPREIARGVEQLVLCAKNFRPSINHILLIAPPLVVPADEKEIRDSFTGAIDKSKMLAAELAKVADDNGCHFFDAASVARSSPVDGVHLDAQEHAKLAQGVCGVVRRLCW